MTELMVTPTSPPMQTRHQDQRACLKCGDPNDTTGPYCDRCATTRRMAIRVLRDPVWPDADERRARNAREAAAS
jgi:hypothetical protein